ncbi:MAG: hypothetical protein OEM81_06305 [Acidimicrobiia bacterium]|nr:hypothetical protein [Acidimicrobiia bacterium]MDH3397433.1 hypothetical protein [Acidimicrobiia bacterium]MDH5615872.1 hypothetical protein [Acidimicrobiia bacterium]
MDTYTRIRRNRSMVKGSAVFVILFSIAGAVFGIRSATEITVLQAVATMVAMALPAAFALASLDRRPSLLAAAVFAAAVIAVAIPEFLPVWLLAGGAWILAIRNRPRPLPDPRWVWFGRPLIAVAVIVPLILLFGHADPACTLTTEDGRVEQVDPAARGLDPGWRWGFPGSSISVSSFESSTGEGTTEVEECSSDRVLPWEALVSLTVSGLIIALAFRWPATDRLG